MKEILKWTSADFDLYSLTWKKAQDFPSSYRSSATPALCSHGTKLWLMHRGDTTNQNIFYTSYEETTGSNGWNPREWSIASGDTFANPANASPAMAVYNQNLVCAFNSNKIDILSYAAISENNDGSINWKLMDGIPGTSLIGPSLAEFNGVLWCAFCEDGDNTLLIAPCRDITKGWQDGAWSVGPKTSMAPALAVFKNELWCVYVGDNRALMITTSKNGTDWTTPIPLGGHTSDSPPTLCWIEEQGVIACVYGDSTGRPILYLTYTNFKVDAWSWAMPISNNPRIPKTGGALGYHYGKYFVAYHSEVLTED
ncbi:hypothetical protein GCM10011491_33120 [Brucella endophytica]|uniref:Uncharacterized protein n=1 Tax=Brucella endophytica TaxID=1963359 RepID=A0A916SIY7_9HYPH|nr:hypothetical protein [Brucella endophytica]GGB02376.1 hypothetical protein GCM10011491_33120 [Brucella endophytica]